MKETLREWDASPASRLNSAKYLPEASTKLSEDGEPLISSYNTPPTLEEDAGLQRFTSIADVVLLSGTEMGRTNVQRLVYIQAMGKRFAAIDSLLRARELSGMLQTAEQQGLDLDSQDPEVKAAIIEDINNLNRLEQRANGMVEAGRLRSMIARVRRKANATLEDETVPAFRREAARRLLDELPDIDDAWAELNTHEPSPELLAAYEPYVRKKYADFLDFVPDDKETFDRHELKELFEAAKSIMATKWKLDNANEWSVDFGRNNVSVDQETKTVWIPKKYGDISADRARQLLVHELGGHLLRCLQGEKTGDVFYATSLPGRGTDEEALLTILENAIAKNKKFYETGASYYIAIGLSLDALESGDKADPHKIQRILTNMALINPQHSETRAREVGLANANRIVRGMPSVVIDGVLHQALRHDDLKYALGQTNAVHWLEENRHNPTALDFVMSSRFAYSDETQVAYGQKLYEEKIHGKFAVPTAA